MQLKESGEMYLETIYVLNKRTGFVRSIDVCDEMGYSKPSVSRAVSILKDGGYLTVGKDGSLNLTELGKEVAERISDAFITQQKQIETPIPLEADGKLRELFIKGGEAFAKDGPNAYKPFLQAYKAQGAIDLAKLCEKLRTKTYEGSDAALKLGNYYLFLLVKEALTLDPEALTKIKAEQLMILEVSDAKGIAEAVPVALARLEYKLANIGE